MTWRYRLLLGLVPLISTGCVRDSQPPSRPRYLVTVTTEIGGRVVSTPPAISCGTVCTGSFSRDTVVTLQPESDPGVKFAGWEGACTGTQLCVLNVHGDAEVRARFVLAATGGPVPAEMARKSDLDGDGLADEVDHCPGDPEDFDDFEDEDGCPEPDNDHDGIPDDHDDCPNVPEDKDGVADGDGCPENQNGDRDGDGMADSVDRCPDDPEDMDGFEDADGCPDADNDGDGILDVDDLCPNDPEVFNGVADDDGCPDRR